MKLELTREQRKKFTGCELAIAEAAIAMFEQNCHADVECALYDSAVKGNIIAQEVWLFNNCPNRWKDPRVGRVPWRVRLARALVKCLKLETGNA